ncbi:MAG: hypothetical protein KatS3mg115_2097 [Candidatus Poribacteria bacterium]|nr:MAG: hypothetical protein KatS3mg115_2097 [Candidatus Poribacteria bacterium]
MLRWQSVLSAQTQEGELPSLHSWHEQLWYRIADRRGNRNHPEEIGFLSRFNPSEDEEYRLDERSYAPDFWEEELWGLAPGGFRYWTGSISHFRLIQRLEGNVSSCALRGLDRRVSSPS